MFNKYFLSNLIYAFSSQFISLALSLILSLIVPKLIGITEFGYWQLFIFYSSYIPFLQLGLNDGAYLINGGKTKDQLDLSSIKTQFIVGTIFESVLSFTIILASFSINGINIDRRFILIQTAINFVLFCSANYLGYIYQAINETKIFSFSIILNKLTFIFFLVLMFFSGYSDYHVLIVGYNLAQIISLIYCLFKGKFIFKAKFLPKNEMFKDMIITARVGIKLMLANIAGMLILGISRYLVDWNWGIRQFAEFSFAISLTNFFLMFINQFSMVLFPSLKVVDLDNQKKYYALIDKALTIFLPIVFISYFPVKIFLNFWLPQYRNSIYYFGLLLPLCTLNGKTSILYNTFFKVRREEKTLLIINLVTLLLSVLFSTISVFYFESMNVLLVSVVFCLVVRNLASDNYLKKAIKLANRNMLADLIFILIFLVLVIFFKDLVGFAVILLYYIAYVMFNYKKINSIFVTLKKGKGNSQ